MNKEIEERRIPRPPNAFMLFGQQHRRTIAQQYPELTNKQISKILGNEWRNMGPDDKGFYHRLADEAYADHMKKYPGYYYSPLEARQRKAERKRKYMQKMTIRRNNNDHMENIIAIHTMPGTSPFTSRNLSLGSDGVDPMQDGGNFPGQPSQQQFIHLNCNLIPTFCPNNIRDFDDISLGSLANVIKLDDKNRGEINGYRGFFGDHCYAAIVEPNQVQTNPECSTVDTQTQIIGASNTDSNGTNNQEKLDEDEDVSNFALLLSDHLPPMDNPSNLITPVSSSFNAAPSLPIQPSLSSFVCSRSDKSCSDPPDGSNFSSLVESLNNNTQVYGGKPVTREKDPFRDPDSTSPLLSHDVSLSRQPKSPRVIVKREPLDTYRNFFDESVLLNI